MFEVIFYRDKDGKSDVEDYFRDLSAKAETSKTDRINIRKILAYLNNLSTHGTRVGTPVVKYIADDIWELRPLSNRIFFFYWKDNKFVLLHYYIKKSQKMPPKEFKIAKRRRDDYIERSK